MARPLALAKKATLDELKSTYLVIARLVKPKLTDKSVLQRFTQAMQQAVSLALVKFTSSAT